MASFFVYAFVDNKALDRYVDFKLFATLEDALNMKESMGNDKHNYDVHKVEVF